MVTEFQYQGFEPDEYVRSEAEVIYEHIQDEAPLGANIVALLDFDGSQYHCTFEVLIKRAPVCVLISDSDVFKALRRAEETILQKIAKNKVTRFFTKNSDLTYKNPKPFVLAKQQ